MTARQVFRNTTQSSEVRDKSSPSSDFSHSLRVRSRGYLPHWEMEGGAYFVTFRLAGSLPEPVLREWEAERARVIAEWRRTQPVAPASLPASLIVATRNNVGRDVGATNHALPRTLATQLREWFSEKVDSCLDAGAGACWLAQPETAKLVQNALLHFDGQRYGLLAWCVMPNHVHSVFRPASNWPLKKILHSWKSFTASEANRILGRKGETFWQHESYDHLVRDENDLRHCVIYTEENPVKARLCRKPEDWPWSSARRHNS